MPVMVVVRTSVPPAANNSIERSTAVINAAPRSPARLSNIRVGVCDLIERTTSLLRKNLVTPQGCIPQIDVGTKQHCVCRLITVRCRVPDCVQRNRDSYHDVFSACRSNFGR